MNHISRKDAYTQGMPRYFTGIACKSGHVAERYVSTGGCLECLNQYRGKFGRMPATSELTRWRPNDGFVIPAGLTPQQYAHLSACLQSWVTSWADHAGVPLTEVQKTALSVVSSNLLKTAQGTAS